MSFRFQTACPQECTRKLRASPAFSICFNGSLSYREVGKDWWVNDEGVKETNGVIQPRRVV